MWTSCVDDEDIDANCSQIDYKVTKVTISRNYMASIYEVYLNLSTPDGKPFTENLTINFDVARRGSSNDSETVVIKAGDASPYLIYEDEGMDADLLYVREIEIITEDCPESEAIVKDNDDINADTEELSCDAEIVDIKEIRCGDEYTFEWSALNGESLNGYTFSVYGVEINLNTGNSATYKLSELNLNQTSRNLIFEGNSCELSSFNVSNCTGTTGTLTLTDPIEGGDNLTVTLADADLAGSGSYQLTITTSLGETESVTLSETEAQSGIFEYSIPTILSATKGANGDGFLHIEKDVIVSVTYDDEFDNEGNNPEPITSTVIVGGELAPTEPVVGEVTYKGVTYTLDDVVYLDDPEEGLITFYLKNNTESQEFYAAISLESSTTLSSGTYTFGAQDFFVNTELSDINLENQVDTAVPFTSGSVELTVGTDRYTLVINLSTAEGTLTGTVEAAFPE
ncbi:hypothetical protein GCM10011506_06910 [Marivirga lumbricoides]|uniref:Calx-beta domain-containing protein n=2 Tax=Marivirga lumbricoides TaxID=1046115 RepID=A0ABQ1LJR3_9BACT|nr:hypothetical protein GCM10011506_06910 [Marivirga lumbricoides]